ncbi:hypothetical protein CAPTEDRAFT_179551 [Capitella teleta]|uniref:Secretory carrier-associated membrane protein n=1 Tax=Capitella teleta TaxID=283909 RepID=R7UJI6_CAPTE|nr:hypothetical protein CAPTEDRAFT_179551 [Capitella teleta]|eukprot:ELU06724.1 hypothetical protein CAPTEDRAFT_179551 [Capitella teleta]
MTLIRKARQRTLLPTLLCNRLLSPPSDHLVLMNTIPLMASKPPLRSASAKIHPNSIHNLLSLQPAAVSAAPQGVPNPQPAVMQPAAVEQPPAYAPSINSQAATLAATEDLKRRQEELERKAAELAKKEQDMQRNLQYQARQNNFPPLPHKCPVQPCFYQDFEMDIPLEFQKIVKIVYYMWIAYVGLLFLNLIGSLAYFIADSQEDNGGKNSGVTFGLSILYLVLFTPCSFVCWYRPLYKAFRSDSSLNFFLFFFIFFFQFCVSVLQAIGIDGWGTVGFLNGLGMVTSSGISAIACGTVMIIIGLFFGILALFDFIILCKVHRIYRSTGASFSKAQAEFGQGIMSNKTVQQTAGNVAANAARGAVQTQMGTGENRY